MRGQLTIINLYGCEEDLSSRKKLSEFCLKLCKVIKMKAFGEPIVKRFGKRKLNGLSAVQFIETSNITIHLDEYENKAFIDIFSCKNFNASKALDFSREYFKAKKAIVKTIFRK